MKSNILIIAGAAFATLSVSACGPKADSSQHATSQETSKESGSDSAAVDYLAISQKYVTQAQATLSKNLMEAINKGGAENALEFCNVHAVSLTDSLSQALHVGLRRVTDKTRNPANQANAMELEHMASLQSRLAKGEPLSPKIAEQNGKMVGYYPIITNALCLQCHGKKDADIMPTTLAKIQTLYPEDKATGYAVNELRGLLVVEMDKQ